MICVVFDRAGKPVVAGAVVAGAVVAGAVAAGAVTYDEVELAVSPLYNQVSVFVYAGSIEVVLARKSSLSHSLTNSLTHSLSHSLT